MITFNRLQYVIELSAWPLRGIVCSNDPAISICPEITSSLEETPSLLLWCSKVFSARPELMLLSRGCLSMFFSWFNVVISVFSDKSSCMYSSIFYVLFTLFEIGWDVNILSRIYLSVCELTCICWSRMLIPLVSSTHFMNSLVLIQIYKLLLHCHHQMD